MSDNATQEAYDKREQELHDYEKTYRKEVLEPAEKQEVVRRNIEALGNAGNTATKLGDEAKKELNELIKKKLTEHIEALKPIS